MNALCTANLIPGDDVPIRSEVLSSSVNVLNTLSHSTIHIHTSSTNTMSRHAHFTAGQTTPPVEKADEETRDGQATPAVEEQEPIPFSRSVITLPLVDNVH